jgi:hypothetical protein
MPWEHCDNDGILDDQSCPACGITKEAWTLQIDVTRNFTVKRRPLVRVRVLTASEDPVSHEPYRAVLPTGDTKEGELDEDGFAKIRSSERGSFQVSFPSRAPGSMRLA